MCYILTYGIQISLCPRMSRFIKCGVQWKQGVVIYMMLYTSLLWNTTPIHCTPLPRHLPVMNTQDGATPGRCGATYYTLYMLHILYMRRYSVTYIHCYILCCIHTYICVPKDGATPSRCGATPRRGPSARTSQLYIYIYVYR